MQQDIRYWTTIEKIAKVTEMSMGQAQEYFELLPDTDQKILVKIAMMPDEEALRS